jgi:Protein of unknown function (DUF3300)
MARWRAVLCVAWLVALPVMAGTAGAAPQAQGGGALDPGYLDKLLAPVALYPDQLLAQMLLCSSNPRKVGELSAWLKQKSALKGSELQKAAEQAGFEPSFVALAPFPQVVDYMAGNLSWTSQLGGAFATDRGAVFDAIQRLRKQSQAAGNLKSTPQQTVETQTTKGGEQVIVIEPANPQVVYVPQYNPQVVYTQSAPTTVVVQEDDDDDEAAAAVIGFAAGIAIGAAIDNNYYYGPYGWRGGAYMYNDGWDDWYDDREDAREDYYENREDAREDWQDNREDMAGERSERAEDAREQRGERSESTQQQRTERQEARGTPEAQAQRDQRRSEAQGRAQEARSTGTTQQARTSATSASTERGSGERSRTSSDRSGTRSDSFSGYSSGRSTRSESSRGSRSRSGGGGRSRRR